MPGFITELAQAGPAPFWLCTIAGGAACLFCFGCCFVLLRRARLMEDTPTSLIRSAAQGYVELSGRAGLMPGPVIVSPLSGTSCVWWSYRVEHRERGDKRDEWQLIEKATSGELFLLSDTTGDCIIDPDHAHINPSVSRSWRGPTEKPGRGPDGGWLSFGDYRYREQLIRIGDLLCTLGWFRSQGAERAFDEAADVRDLLAEWKRDQARLLARFDTNHDGQIDLQEWEAVRRAALDEVRQHALQNAINPDLHVLSAPHDGRPFILSTLSQSVLARRLRWQAGASLLAAAALGYFCALLLSLRLPG
ncbi:MAG: GIDE domain-containing protein [Stenotrophobium sp.]